MNDAPSVTGKLPGDAAFRRRTLKGSSIEATYAGALSFMRRKYTAATSRGWMSRSPAFPSIRR